MGTFYGQVYGKVRDGLWFRVFASTHLLCVLIVSPLTALGNSKGMCSLFSTP